MKHLPGFLALGLTLAFAVGTAWADSSVSEAKGEARVEDLLRTTLDVWKDGEVLVTRFELPEGHSSKKHSHPGEGFLYVIEGSMTMFYEDGRELSAGAGELMKIPMGEVHKARPSSKGVKGIIFRGHPKGEPERELVD